MDMGHIESRFKGHENIDLYSQCWLPKVGIKAVLLLVHGLAEHSGRYTNVANYFVQKGYAICSFDYSGHGKSKGLRGYIKQFSYYLDDLKLFLDMVHNLYPENKIFIVGHSVGGTIATSFTINHQNEFDGLILSGATIIPGSSLSPMKIVMAKFLSLIFPKIGVDRIDASAISRDQSVVDGYINDPLVYHGKISARLGVELIKAMQIIKRHEQKIKLPILILQGTEDRLSDPEGSRMLYERVGSQDKAIKFYDSFYHEVFNEPKREQVFRDMEAWLVDHV
jgi:alpha-beta hydrolase superfamily lysophospholipase